MFHREVVRGLMGCMAFTAILGLGGCGGQQISSTAQDRSLEQGNDAEMARAGGVTPDNASLSEESLPLGSETVPDSPPASSSDAAPGSEPVPETETVGDTEVAAVSDTDSTSDSEETESTMDAADSGDSESMLDSSDTDSTTEAMSESEPSADRMEPSESASSESSTASDSTDDSDMIAGLVPEEPTTLAPESSMSPAAAASSGFEDVQLEDIYFDFDRFALREDARAKLDENADQLKHLEGWSLVIEGHCDERGTEAYNLVLGERRASTVKDYLGELGVSVADIKIVSYGKERPFCTEHNDECWRSNRRAHFIIK